MNSQSVPKASFAPHESDHVWSQRECQAWPSRKNLARQSLQITDDLFHVQHNGFTLIIHASQVLRQEAHMDPEAPKTPREEKSRTLQLGFKDKITMLSFPSHKWCLHRSIGLSLAALRMHGCVWRGGANLNPSHYVLLGQAHHCASVRCVAIQQGHFSNFSSLFKPSDTFVSHFVWHSPIIVHLG